jgi:hypothetical protein
MQSENERNAIQAAVKILEFSGQVSQPVKVEHTLRLQTAQAERLIGTMQMLEAGSVEGPITVEAEVVNGR